MPKAKYEGIYKDLRHRIEKGEYLKGTLLPTEHSLIEVYQCSRNTLRRAIAQLGEEGYVQSMQGRGVRVIYQPDRQRRYTIGGIETFRETAIRNNMNGYTQIIAFTEMTVDDHMFKKSGFPMGAPVYFVQRVRYLEHTPVILDNHLFLKSAVPGLTEKIAEKSIYDYMEKTLGMQVVTCKRTMTVEKLTQVDEKYLELAGYNCLAVVTSKTYNGEGVLFEYTQSRHRPDYFCYQDIVTRKIPEITL